MGQRIVQVDAFTAEPYRGNPAAVCVLPKPADARWMQDVAREMNLAETAFLVPRDGGREFDLRWFTPAAEVDLCGHATLASAQVLWEDGHLPPGRQARFHTRSGLLTADRHGDWIEMDFPAVPAQPLAPLPGLLDALGARAAYLGKNRFDYLVELDSEAAVRALRPDFTVLRRLPIRGVIVTARSSTPAFDFVSRFFAPGVGVDEDPVTGSAHCCLTPYWAAKFGKEEMTGYQASARGGVVRVRLLGDRVVLSGQAVTVLRGELTTSPAPSTASSPDDLTSMPNITGVLETALYVEDLPRSEAFYRELFGFPRLDGDDRFAALEVLGRQVLLLFKRGAATQPIPLPFGVIPPHDGAGRLHLAFSIPAADLGAWQERLRAGGIVIESHVTWPRGGTSLYFRDPDGHLVELATPGLWWNR